MRLMTSRLVGLAVAAIALAAAQPSAVQAQGLSFWVMSYNIRYDNPDDRPDWRARRGPMARQIGFFAPDILGVQEALPPMVADLSAALPGYDHYGVGRDDGDKVGETTTIFYRGARFERAAGPDPLVLADAGASRQGLRRSPAHRNLCPGRAARPRPAARVLDVRNAHLDHKGPEVAAAVRPADPRPGGLARCSPGGSGRLQQRPGDPPHDALTSGDDGLRDARVASPVVFGPAGTFNDFSPGAPPAGPSTTSSSIVRFRCCVSPP
ncbi:endonuclease/exonuclease/phosphatase family protein [Caulobacter segnis]